MKRILLLSSVFAFCLWGEAWAQDRTVTGKVTSQEDGTALPGVNVTVKGTSMGTSTGTDGSYSILVGNTATLVFSFIGFTIQEIEVGARTVMDVPMKNDVRVLGEVVITALGLEAEGDKQGTAISSVKGGALVQSGETSLINGIAAKTPGVLIQRSSGDPGASSNIQIRGQSTITGNLQPLIVVDGIPISNSSIGDGGIVAGTGDISNQTNGVVQQSRLNDINPNDIASMEVLKGASAAALWGTRAANGVIVITTKKGKRGDKPSISFRSSYGVDQINRVPELQTAYGQGLNGRWSVNARSWGDKIADRSGGPDAFITDPDAPGYNGFITFPDGSKRYALAAGTAANPHGGKNSKEVFDHAKEVFHNGYTRDNSLTISGGDEKSNYYVSIGNTYTKGIALANSDYDRTTFRVNADRKLARNFKSAATFSFSRTNSNRVQQGSNISGIFLGGLRSAPDFNNALYTGDYTGPDGVVTLNQQSSYRNPLGDPTHGTTQGGSGFDSPFWTIQNVKNNSKVNRVIGSLEFTYDPTSWLSIINRTGLDTYTDRRMAYFPIGAAAIPTGSLTEEVISETQLNNDLIARATKEFSSKFGGSLLVGFNLNERKADQVGANVTNIINPFSPAQLPNSPSTARSPYNLATTIRTGALYAQVDLQALDMFFLNVTGRAETASTFGTAQNTFYYPSSALAWQFTKLPMFQDDNPLNFGKVRVAYGTVGVQPAPYQTRTYLIPASSGNLSDGWGTSLDAANYGGGYLRSTVQGNNTLKPERKTEIETGLDLRFFNNRLKFSGTYYANQTVDAILQVPVAATNGFLSKSANAAKLQNHGVELQLDADIVTAPNFAWTISPNWSRNVSKVVKLQGSTNIALNGFSGNSINPSAVEGQPMGALYGSRTLKDDTGKPVLDDNGFIQLDPTSGVVGNPNPQWRAGIGNTFTFFKKLSLFVLVDHVHAMDIQNGTRGTLYSYGTHRDVGNEVIVSADQAAAIKNANGQAVDQFGTKNADGSYSFRGALHDYGAGAVALDESWYRNTGGGFNGPGDQFVEHISYTRIREATLTYSLSSAGFRDHTKLQSIDFSFTGRNLFLFTNYKGVDPETNLTGVSNGRGLDYFNNPSTKSFIFTLKINY